MKMNMKRGLVTVLTAAMLVSSVPSTVVFADTLTTATWVQNGDEWELYIYTSEDGGEATETRLQPIRNERAATCTEDGEITWSAPNGETSEVKSQILPATGHTAAEAVRENETAPTCTENGSYDTVVYCAVCGAEIGRDTTEIPATGHTPAEETVVENEVAPNCTEAGSYDEVLYCTVCGEALSREIKTIEANGHVFENYAVNKEATCTEDGYAYAECKVCGEREKQVIPATGHTPGEPVEENRKEATCTEAGSYEEVVYCDTCKEELSRETKTIEALGHEYELTGTFKEATCTTEGVGYYKCAVCGDEKEDVIPVIPHTPGEAVRENEVAPTCTEDGSYEEVTYCTVCEGEASRETIIVDALGHTPGETVIENEVKPTCTEDGSHDEVVYCTVCEEELSRETVVDKAAGEHTPGEAVEENVVPATCVAEGSYDEVVYCTVCEEELSREAKTLPIDPDGHDYQVTTTVTEATCTKDGEGYYACVLCGDKKESPEVIPAKGHTPGEPVEENRKEATCTEDGSYEEVVYCTVCKEEITRETKVIEKLGHNYNVEYISKEETCTETGLGYAVCERCGDKQTSYVIEKKPHTPGEVTIENNTFTDCTQESTYDEVVYCTVCEGEISRETKTVEAAENHTYSADDVEFIYDNDEFTSGVAVFKCTNKSQEDRCNDVHRIMFSVDTDTTDLEVAKEETCTETGLGYYVATASYGGVTATAPTRAEVVIPATGHKAGEAVRENEVAATHTTDGSFDTVVYCDTCGEVLSRETTVVPATGHTEETRIEDYKAPTCTEDGSYKTVIYCTEGDKEEVVSETITIPATGHIENTAVKENAVAATCTTEGSYDTVVYCAVCGEELSRETTKVEALGHKEAEAVKENAVAATCTTEGSYDTVVYCAVCGEELSRETTKVEALGHKPAEPVKEKEIAATATKNASYEEVVYCAVCGEELSRKTVTVPKKDTAIALAGKTVTYNGKAVVSNSAVVSGSKGSVTYTYYADAACTKKISAPVAAGTYYVKAAVASDVNYNGASSNIAKITIKKAAQSVTKVTASKKLKYSKVKKANQKFTIKASVKGGAKVTFKKTSGSSKIKVSSTGKVTVKKGLKKGTYKIKVKITTKATANYPAKSITKTIKITVK